MNRPFPLPFKVELFRDLLAEPPTKTWIIEDVLGAAELSVVYGAPGDGKSVLAGDAACHVTAGLPWFGKPVRRVGVLYIAAERGTLVKRRMAAWAKRYGYTDLPIAVADEGLNLVGSEEDAKRVVSTVYKADVEEEVGWIIIDTKPERWAAATRTPPRT
jgi:RecA-family ATPase